MRETAIGTLKYVLVLILVGAVFVLAPAQSVGARAAGDPTATPAGDRRDVRLERIWLRQQRILARLGFLFDHSSQRLQNAQELIDRADEQGKDVDALQAALDAFSDALQAARPSFESAKGVLNSHKGFDGEGNVIDGDLAAATVAEMAEKLDVVRDDLLQPGRDLRDAIRSFREGNRRSSS